MLEFDKKEKTGKPQTPLIFGVRYQLTMVIKIGHDYGQNITSTEAINGNIKSLNIIDEWGTSVSAVKSKNIWKENPANYMVETSMIADGENLYRQL